jgi:hypothetical protein
MDSLDLFFKKFAYKFPKGYPDMNNEQDINLLADLLEGLGMNLNEAETQDFESFMQKKSSSILPEFIDKVNTSLSDDQKSRILKEASDDVSKIISFLNNNQDISQILTKIKGGPQGEGNMGPGEVAVLTCSPNGKKISGRAGDVELSGKSYELKGGAIIKAGGTYKPSIIRLTTTLWNLKQEVFEGDKAEQYKKILGPELFNDWEDFRKLQKNKEGEIDFTSIGKEKLSQIKSFFEKLRLKIKQISDEDTLKPNVISVGSKDFEVSKDELEKIAGAKPGENLSLKGKVVLSSESETTLNKLRQNLKILVSSKIMSEEANLDDAIKHEFIKDIDGLINIIDNKYILYTQEDFMSKWEFISLTQGNRPQFALKGTKLTEEEENKAQYL